MRAPSFQEHYARVRMVRLWFAILTFLVVGSLARANGLDWDDVMLRGVGAAVVAFFLGWASALWIASEIYNMQVRRLEDQIREAENARAQQLRNIGAARGVAPDGGPALTENPPPGRNEAA